MTKRAIPQVDILDQLTTVRRERVVAVANATILLDRRTRLNQELLDDSAPRDDVGMDDDVTRELSF